MELSYFLEPILDEPMWYADEYDGYRDESYYSIKLKTFATKVNDYFKGKTIYEEKFSYYFRLYRMDSMGHNVSTGVELNCENHIIQSVSISSYDKHPGMDPFEGDGLVPKYDSSEWICHLQIHQVIDLLNSLCKTHYQYVYCEQDSK